MNKEWFVFKDTFHLGPFTTEEIANFYQSKEISPQTLLWREGAKKWEPLSKIEVFNFIFLENKKVGLLQAASVSPDENPPPLPYIPTLPEALQSKIIDWRDHDDEGDTPPPIPLDAIINPNGFNKKKSIAGKNKLPSSRLFLICGAIVFIFVLVWFATNEKNSGIQVRIKGLMPVYLEKLEMNALSNSPNFEVELALSLDGQVLWASTNYSGDIRTVIKLDSIPKRVLGTEKVVLLVKGELSKHVGKFNRMILSVGSKFLPGEYNIHVEGRQTHFLNRHFKSLSGFTFFKSLNKTFSYNGKTLIYSGTPREFEKKINDYHVTIVDEMLKPFQDKLERIKTFESLLNATSQNYLMELEKIKTGKGITLFEAKFIKEISPLLQSLVLKAHQLSTDPKFGEEAKVGAIAPYREQVLIGKQIGEMASDMITKTLKFKKISEKNKSELLQEFEKRARAIKLQIDLNIKKLDEQILNTEKSH